MIFHEKERRKCQHCCKNNALVTSANVYYSSGSSSNAFYLYRPTGVVRDSTLYHAHVHRTRGCGLAQYYLHPAWGGLFKTKNGLLFYETFFVNLYDIRTHCVQCYSTEDLIVHNNINITKVFVQNNYSAMASKSGNLQ